MENKVLHLVCNSHLDPVWLWMWEEGAAETLTTFRTAAEFCDEFKEFVFCHNESLLYDWIEEFEPELHKKIKDLVKEKSWRIIGGWYVQPDCNLPCGESFVRQILIGKNYFMKTFGVEPETAINFDPFGHTRGLVQILKKSGYSSYLFCRPDVESLSLPSNDFIWVGYDGSEILAHRAPDHYNSQAGKARTKVDQWLADNANRRSGLILWGIGDHGGGPSREDLKQLRKIIQQEKKWEIRHSYPEEYFKDIEKQNTSLLRYEKDLNPWAVGCYTTMAKVKQKHRQLENTYYLTEKMVSHAALEGLMEYPSEELQLALEDILFCEFHDILPGSGIAQVEEYAIQRMNHGLEILARLKLKAFLCLVKGYRRAAANEFPIFVYNPHPFFFNHVVVCEFQPNEPNFDKDTFMVPEIKDDEGHKLNCQLEKEGSNIADDQRKRVVFSARLKPGQMNRFSCNLLKRKKPIQSLPNIEPYIEFQSDRSRISLNTITGLIDRFRVEENELLLPNSFRSLVIEDYADPWGMQVDSFRKVIGHFTTMAEGEAAEFAGLAVPEIKPVRIVEDGPIRMVVEALFHYNRSFICQRYILPKKNSRFEVEIRVYWNEKDKMLKLSIPTVFHDGVCNGQVAYGVEENLLHEKEQVAQKWVGIRSTDKPAGIVVINDGTYGFDFAQGEIRPSLLRSAAYAAHPTGPGIPLVPQDRLEPRIDQGERVFRFWIDGGNADKLFTKIDRDALAMNEKPVVLCCYPPGLGNPAKSSIQLSENDDSVLITAVKYAEEDQRLIIRFFEPTGKSRKTRVKIPSLDLSFDLSLGAFELKTIAVDLKTLKYSETDLMERDL